MIRYAAWIIESSYGFHNIATIDNIYINLKASGIDHIIIKVKIKTLKLKDQWIYSFYLFKEAKINMMNV